MTVDEYGAVRAHAVRLCLAAGATVEEAEDCVHEALVELLEVADPDSVRTPAGWVATVSRRRFIDQVRRRCRERVASRREHAAALAPVDPADLVADRDLARYLVRSMADLPRTTREVCAAIGEGKSEADVAESLGLSARAVESHLTRARRRLRKLRIALVLPVGVCCARIVQRLAVPLTCAAVATPVATVMLLPGSPSHRQPLSGPETPAALTTTVAPTTVTTTPTPVVVTTTPAPTTSSTSSASAPPPTAASTSSAVPEVVTHVKTVISEVLDALPTTLPSLPELPIKLPLDH
ncbi:RNA polymerase sigma factor [Kutzneria sp. CA-103260]|uniref:RNA polymerase sigma factor n=1 Tax=Kutzneria sp. CA-103260 TaxID=2802641 RepID=UPI001BA82BEC|nr:sigma-70 family RNA polymerase sigma factor [Kutzneria sp. CA-103260]QUQ63592.1 Sigma-70, region 4 [Kutzneria sp. CA-103260]